MPRPVVCMMITSRARPGGGTDPADGPLDALRRRVAAVARGRAADLVQIRERDLDGGPLFQVVRRCVEAVRGTPTRILVNDRLDVALAAGAHGVHLRGTSIPASRARAIAPHGFLIGRSVHGIEEAVAAEAEGGLDYLVFGPLFATASKPDTQGTGPDALASVVQAVRLPVLAVGGITAATAGMAGAAGAAGLAAIGLFSGGTDDEAIGRAMAARRAFETGRPSRA